MKLSLDTVAEKIHMELSPEELSEKKLPLTILEFSDSLAMLFVDFCMHINCDTQAARELAELVLKFTKENITANLDEGILE